MSHRTAVAGVGLLALALTPSVAEARFGKAGSGSSSGSRSSGSSSSSSSSSSHHAAVPASSDGSSGSSGSDGSGASPAQPAPATPFYGASGHRSAWAFGYRPWWWTPAPYGYYDGSGLAPAYGYPPPPYAYAGPAAVNLSAEGQAHNQGALLGFNLAFERDRVGLAGQFQAIFAMAEDGSGDLDTIKLANVYFTYAILSDPHGRLRLEVGGASAFAPDLIALGPSGGVSGAMGLIGPVGVELSVHYTPLPFVGLTWAGGVTVALGPWGLRAGWRQIWLSDNGVVDGVVHTDLFSGPYVGLALAL